MAILQQVLGTFILCFLCMTMGVMFTWPSSTLMIFSSANTTLHRTMNEGEIALLGSLSSVGALISTPLGGIFLDRLGRKPCAIISACMSVISWSMIASSNRVEVVLTAIFISGLSSAAFLVNTVYVSEMCQDSIRGAMMACSMIFYNIGMLVSYVLGGTLSYLMMVYVSLTLSIIGVLGLFLLKESPMFLMSKGREEEAAKSLGFYRGLKPDSKEIQSALENIRNVLNADADDSGPEEKMLNDEKKKPEKLPLLQFIKKSRCTQRALIVSLTLMTASIFQGLPVLQVYAEPLFAEAVPVMSSNLCSIIFALIGVVVGLLSAYLTDAAGRRPLIIYGSTASGICCLVLGSQIHLNWGPNWMTAVAIYTFTVVYMLGAGIVPFVLIGEVFLPEVKSFVSMLVLEWTWLCYFLVLLIFNPLVAAVGLGPVFYVFSAICFLTVAFSYFFQPETKGLTMENIQEMFSPKKKRQIA